MMPIHRHDLWLCRNDGLVNRSDSTWDCSCPNDASVYRIFVARFRRLGNWAVGCWDHMQDRLGNGRMNL